MDAPDKEAMEEVKDGETVKKTTSSATRKKASVSSKSESDDNKNTVSESGKSTAKTTQKKSAKKKSTNEIFADLPKSAEPLDIIDLGIEDEEAKRIIEEEAIAALPHAESIDTLLFDFVEEHDSHETPEETATYENFLADYKQTIAAIFEEVSKNEIESTSQDNYDNEDEDTPLLVKRKEIDITLSPSDSTQESAGKEEATEAPLITFTNSADHSEIDSPNMSDTHQDLPAPQDAYEEKEDALVQMAIDFGDIANELIEESSPTEPPISEKTPSKDKYDPEKPRLIDSIFDFVELFVFTLLAVFILTSFFFRHSVVSGGSMENTLKDGEHLIISHLFYTPKRGDIIVFEDREAGVTSPYIKRVIGIEGDEVVVNPDGTVYVNGELLEEKYVFKDGPDNKKTGTYPVGEGEVFVMGDHRNVSEDSRKFDCINVDSILGKVVLRFYPFSEFGTVE